MATSIVAIKLVIGLLVVFAATLQACACCCCGFFAIFLQRLLLELQSAVALSPAAVPQLLQAVQPQHRHQLAEALLALRDQHQDNLVGQEEGAAADLIEQLQQLSVVDVLLLISLAAQQQWAADVSLVLMHGVLEADRWECSAAHKHRVAPACVYVLGDMLIGRVQASLGSQASATLEEMYFRKLSCFALCCSNTAAACFPCNTTTHSSVATLNCTEPCGISLQLQLTKQPAAGWCLRCYAALPSLQQLCSLYEGLACNAAGAADWLLHVGVTWASTCHVDLPQVGRQYT